MASIFLKPTIILLLIFSALSIAIASVLDTDGEPLVNGGQYYIIPQSAGIGGGLTLISKSDASPCPLHITRDKDETSLGIPVTITSLFKVGEITDGVPINILFKDTPNICMQPLAWQMIPDETTGQFYVATGGSGFLPTESFMIVQIGDKNVYKMRYIGEFDETLYIGIFEKDGLLGSTNEIPLPVVFKKASFDVLKKTS